MDVQDERLEDLQVVDNVLDMVYLGKCPFTYSLDCVARGALITDFNIWSQALEKQVMMDWTSCR